MEHANAIAEHAWEQCTGTEFGEMLGNANMRMFRAIENMRSANVMHYGTHGETGEKHYTETFPFGIVCIGERFHIIPPVANEFNGNVPIAEYLKISTYNAMHVITGEMYEFPQCTNVAYSHGNCERENKYIRVPNSPCEYSYVGELREIANNNISQYSTLYVEMQREIELNE
jgi:hypothetical protein